ncbi:MAG TPA: type II toxin-antitoxin system prevent-host-death family antitoxin [Acidimicrobiia bacterium]|nr:type II toxin-antitoxin system prevent-host-death family antitoxin [Acidimicrobiia bacterium]
MDQVGVRELKQNASRVLERVKQGEALEVTDRGQPVALIVPIPKGGVVERLIAEGRATSPRGNLSELPPPRRPRAGTRLPSEVLADLRSDER